MIDVIRVVYPLEKRECENEIESNTLEENERENPSYGGWGNKEGGNRFY